MMNLQILARSSVLRYNAVLLSVAAALLFLWPELWRNLLETDGFMNHFECYLGKPELVWMHVFSDSVIGIS